MTHSRRPVPAKRIFAFEPHYPVREADGDDWHIGPLLDTRQLRIKEARDTARRMLKAARAARMLGTPATWHVCMCQAAMYRERFAGLLRSGGRVDWRGQPVTEGEQLCN